MKAVFYSLVVIFFVLNANAAFAQAPPAVNTLGGHIGVVTPILVASASGTSFIGSTPVGFPTGITVKPGGDFVFDLEFVPFVQFVRTAQGRQTGIATDLLFHPGVVYTGAGGGVGIGVRGAIEFSGAVGFTPILNKSLFPVGERGAVFAELVLPVRFTGAGSLVAVALHIGVGF